MSAAPSPGRRSLLAFAGLAAASAGAGLAYWRSAASVAPSTPGEPVPGFWSLQWEGPQGAPAVRAADFRGRPLLINFWATWCAPCVEELPRINQTYLENRVQGLQVLALAIDSADAVRGFLARLPLQFPIAVAAGSGTALARQLGDMGGVLPFSVLLGADGSILQRRLGALGAGDLATWARLK